MAVAQAAEPGGESRIHKKIHTGHEGYEEEEQGSDKGDVEVPHWVGGGFVMGEPEGETGLVGGDHRVSLGVVTLPIRKHEDTCENWGKKWWWRTGR